MKRFVLSKYYEIEPFEADMVPRHLEARQFEESSILFDRSNSSRYLINNIISTFLEYFREPAALETVMDRFAQLAECPVKEIEPVVLEFFQDMMERGILVPEGTVEPDLIETPGFNPGECLDNFRIINVIDIGPKGELYLAESLKTETISGAAVKEFQDLPPGTQVVLKLLSPVRLADEESFQRARDLLLKEYRYLEKMKGHHGVCRAYGFAETEYTYMILEYIAGRGLREYLAEQTLTPNEKIRIIHQLLTIFADIHRRNILHGDIHAGNFIVTADGNLKVIDFGYAVSNTPEADEIVTFGGVPYYLPPERLDDDSFTMFSKEVDPASEVYQLGVVIYLILYERMPFYGFTWTHLLEAVANDPPDLPAKNEKGQEIPVRLRMLLEKALAKQPEERFASAVELAEAFDR